jgi:hypothetical protein
VIWCKRVGRVSVVSAVVAVRLGSGVKSFRATVGSVVVTGAFARRGTSRVATLRYGTTRGLRFGRNTVYFRTVNRRGQRGYSQVSFVLARRVRALMSAVAGQPPCGAGAKVRVVLIRSRLSLRVWVNGRTSGFGAGGRSRVLSLDGDHGLRPGSNVQVRALDSRKGAYSTSRVRVVMPSSTPVAGAGPSKRQPVGQVVRFSAGASTASRGARLRYRWTVALRPRGSKARLRHAFSAHPSLRPDRAGKYVLRRPGHPDRRRATADGRTGSSRAAVRGPRLERHDRVGGNASDALDWPFGGYGHSAEREARRVRGRRLE